MDVQHAPDASTSPMVPLLIQMRERCSAGKWHDPATGYVPAALTVAYALDAYIFYSDEARHLRAVEVQKQREAERRRNMAHANQRVLREQALHDAEAAQGDAEGCDGDDIDTQNPSAKPRKSAARNKRRRQRFARIR